MTVTSKFPTPHRKGFFRKLLALNAFMFVAELVVGIIGESTGVIADSLDMLADALVYGIALYAVGRCPSIKNRAVSLVECSRC